MKQLIPFSLSNDFRQVLLVPALTAPPLDNHPVDAVPRSDSTICTAWGETKSLPQWAKDKRCIVLRCPLLEDAMTMP